MTYYTTQVIDSYKVLPIAFDPQYGIMVTLNRETHTKEERI